MYVIIYEDASVAAFCIDPGATQNHRWHWRLLLSATEESGRCADVKAGALLLGKDDKNGYTVMKKNVL